jgi:hypothetical protein
MTLRQLAFVCLMFVFLNQALHASCLAPPSYQETFEVLSCEEVNLNNLQSPPNWQGLLSYQGVILQINSLSEKKTSSRKGYNNSTVERLPKRTRVFYQTKEKQPCTSLNAGTKRKGIRTWACCDGDPNPPCLLDMSDYVYDLK